MLTLELRKLEDAGIVHRTVFEGYPLRVEYDLTAFGLKLVPLIDALGDWWERRKPAAARSEATPSADRVAPLQPPSARPVRAAFFVCRQKSALWPAKSRLFLAPRLVFAALCVKARMEDGGATPEWISRFIS